MHGWHGGDSGAKTGASFPKLVDKLCLNLDRYDAIVGVGLGEIGHLRFEMVVTQ